MTNQKPQIKNTYYPNGNLKSVFEINAQNEYHGTFKTFYETGELLQTGNFVNNKQQGLFTLHDKSGHVIRVSEFKDHNHVSSKEYYKNGKLRMEVKYPDNIRAFYNFFNTKGELVFETAIAYLPSKTLNTNSQKYEKKYVAIPIEDWTHFVNNEKAEVLEILNNFKDSEDKSKTYVNTVLNQIKINKNKPENLEVFTFSSETPEQHEINLDNVDAKIEEGVISENYASATKRYLNGLEFMGAHAFDKGKESIFSSDLEHILDRYQKDAIPENLLSMLEIIEENIDFEHIDLQDINEQSFVVCKTYERSIYQPKSKVENYDFEFENDTKVSNSDS